MLIAMDFMNGVALLGPLPSHFNPMFRFIESYDGFVRVSLDYETDEILYEDPRQGSLPTG